MNLTYATLNKRGQERLGKIFPELKVPLFTILSKQMTIAGITDFFYFADYSRFTNDQKRMLAKFMNDERGIPKNRVQGCLNAAQNKVPICAKYVDIVFEIKPRLNA